LQKNFNLKTEQIKSMRFFYVRQVLAFLSLFLACHCLNAQTEIKGKVLDANTGESLPFAVIKVRGTTNGVSTDYDGTFTLSVSSLPVVLEVSLVGYESQNIDVSSAAKPLSIKLGDKVVLLGDGKQVVEVVGQRITEKAKSAQFTVESMDKLAIKQTASVSFYEGMGALKGVDATTASIGFTVINTRGFNSTSPVRSLQIIDGVDNQAPGLNFSLGNFLGSSELDVLKADLIVGASSAFYGPNAFNGVLSMETKNPFFVKGLSAQVKVGERALNEVAFRYADAFKNKSGHDAFAFKLNMYFLKAYDWVADNYDPVTGTKTGKTNPGGYDAVNRYGDERDATYDYTSTNQLQPWLYVGVGQFHRTGYNEIDLVDYNTRNIKANAAFHVRLKPELQENSPELIASSNFGSGTTVYQGDNRFSLKNILFFQNRLELRKRDKYFVRLYATNEDAGDSYDPYFTALRLQNNYKNNSTWRNHYLQYWRQTVDGDAISKGYPELQIIPIPDPPYIKGTFDRAAAATWLQGHSDWLLQAHQSAASYANTFQTKEPYFEAGTQRFADEFARITSTLRTNGGTKFYDKSALYHLHGEYHFQPKGLNDWTIGANSRMYTPISNGALFIDTNGRKITNLEFGVYTGIEKRFLEEKLKFNATLRLDKNQNFNYLFSPAVSLVWKPDSLNFVRLSFSSAIRNPTLNDQYLNLNVGRAILAGNINGFNNLITPDDFISYIEHSFIKTYLKYFNVAAIRPEKVKSLELGYRTTLFGNTFVDMSYYFSFYNDFIGYQVGVTSQFDDQTGIPYNVQAYRVAANAQSSVTTQGFSIGINHYFAKYYQVAGNYSWNVLNTKTDDPIIPAFNTPANKFNLSVSGRNIEIGNFKNFGFNLNYKWIEGFRFQGSPQFSGEIPTYDLLDLQLNYFLPKASTTIKIGASNILDKKQFQTYGGPKIGRMAYISLLYDWMKK
jgi:iron complex outermembrane recepter protein